MSVITRRFPLRLVSMANARVHYMQRHRHVTQHRTLARLGLQQPARQLTAEGISNGVVVTMVRVAPRVLDDDNLRMACKGIRDGIADAFGVDDGSDFYTWAYGQKRGGAREYAVEITIAPRQGDVRCSDSSQPMKRTSVGTIAKRRLPLASDPTST